MKVLGITIDVESLLRKYGFRKPKRFLSPYATIDPEKGGSRARRINTLLPLSGEGRRYLEIGVFAGRTLEAVRAPIRVGVDPFPEFRLFPIPPNIEFHQQTSRDFFRNYAGAPFDLIFLDGLHTSEETYLDFVESLEILHPGGTVLIDDVLPSDPESAIPDRQQSTKAKKLAGIEHARWYGDVWRLAVLILRKYTNFQLVLIGTVGEHCQAAVRLKHDKPLPHFDHKADIEAMNSFDFTDCVMFGPNSLTSLAPSERFGLERFLQSVER